ncbi:MAG: hypothetical protein LBL15_00375 [Oscillospiraceae bacterium]|jgi:hypothetical protein|nr:hypothetical protein [Oscillospiraceae bacterium]
MSGASQIKNMKRLHELLSQNLGYIFGERESGPNGAKKQFLSTGRAFLSALGRDLGFSEQTVSVNKAGIAVSGDVTLMGMWGPSNGLYVVLEQDLPYKTCMMYRGIRHMKDYRGGENRFIPLSEMGRAGYNGLLAGLLAMKEAGDGRKTA